MDRTPEIDRAHLFERLALGHADNIVVLTPNTRLAQSLARDFDRHQAERGLASWETADILPFGAFVQRLWEEALYSDLAPGLPVLLTPAQEVALWDEAIASARIDHPVFSAPGAAQQCVEAWRLVHGWRLPRADRHGNEDASAFQQWSATYERALREQGQTDAARLPDVMVPLLARLALGRPATVVLHGFDIVTPQMRDFLAALAAAGCEVARSLAVEAQGRAVRIELTEYRDEVEAAARWARARLEADPQARIGVVVPDLARTREQVRRLFAAAMQPDFLVAGPATLPFNISLGAPLDSEPLVADALGILMLCGRGAEFGVVSRVLRSPFIAGSAAELAARARLDARLRERVTPVASLDALLRLAASPRAPAAPLLLERLGRLADFRKSDLFAPRGAADWARAFLEALRVLGFPGDRTLDSREHQALERWHDLLAELATLDRVAGTLGYAQARDRLARLAAAAVFQPQSPEVPVQIVGVLESAGIEFDHLWVLGMNDDAWPLPANPNPFVPVQVQRAAGIPQADPAASLELDRRITRGWCRSAREVVFSHARMRDESELAPSPLVAALPLAKPDSLHLGAAASFRAAIRAGLALETIADAVAPPAGEGLRPGGTRLFRDQAACPFLAVARHRLGSKPLETPRPGLQPRDRGSLLHTMLALVWERIGDRATLASMPARDLAQLLDDCARATIEREKRHRAEALGGRFGQLEQARLGRLAGEWLAKELERPDFRVVSREEKRAVTFGGVTVNAKLDRMDELAAGGRAIIDYKTGECATRQWMGPRPEEPQLPMYARAEGDGVAAVAFGIVRTGEMGFKGIGAQADLMPGVKLITKDQSRPAKRYRDWKHLVASWSEELEALGRAFAAGDARVDPKRGWMTCQPCDQKLFCRVAEKAPFGSTKGEGDE